MQPPARMLSIGELAEQTGLSPATLRMWETRHGFPEAKRQEIGHRRHEHRTVDRVRAVLARQSVGVRLDAAIAALAALRPATTTVPAQLRRPYPTLVHPLLSP